LVWKDEKARLEGEVKVLKSEVENLRLANDSLETLTRELEEKNADARVMEELEEKVATLESEKEGLQADLDMATTRVNEVCDRSETQQRQIAQLEVVIRDLEHQKNGVTTDLEAAANKIRELCAKIEALQQQTAAAPDSNTLNLLRETLARKQQLEQQSSELFGKRFVTSYLITSRIVGPREKRRCCLEGQYGKDYFGYERKRNTKVDGLQYGHSNTVGAR
jgi:chromosome segregation ATPase